jgi:hypothetical protein
MKIFPTNPDIHSINIRYRHNLHVPNNNLSNYKRGVYENLPNGLKVIGGEQTDRHRQTHTYTHIIFGK